MEPQDPNQALRIKIQQSIDRSAQLITSNKHYEFTQKIKMLAQRKAQTHKLLEAQLLLQLGAKKMLDQKEIEYNATHDLIIALIELYEEHKELWKSGKALELYNLLTSKPNDRNVDYFIRVLKKLSSIQESPEMVEYIVSTLEIKGLFYKAQNIIAHLELSRVTRFLQKWHEKVDNDEYAIIVSRMALLKGLEGTFDESQVLLSDLDSLNPFVKFVKFLILSVQMKSRDGFDKIGTEYHKFLKSDSFFEEIYTSYGSKFFKKEKGNAGLLNLLEQ